MHPIFNHSSWSLLILLFYFAITYWFSMAMQILTSVPKNFIWFMVIPWLLILIIFCCMAYAFIQHKAIQSWSNAWIVSMHLLIMVLLIGLWVSFGFFYAYLFNLTDLNKTLGFASLTNFIQVLPFCVVFSLIVYLISLLSQLLYQVYKVANQAKQLIADQQQHKDVIELSALKASIHPHFLFNSLNTIAHLSQTNADKALNFCQQLSGFLRYSIQYGNNTKVSWFKELEHVNNYLNIEKERFSSRLDVKIDLKNIPEEMLVPPLLLFPLIENAVKHGIGSCTEGGFIQLVSDIKDNHFHFKVINSFDPSAVRSPGTEFGLSSIKKRLRAFYGNSAQLHVQKENTTFTVILVLPLDSRKNTKEKL